MQQQKPALQCSLVRLLIRLYGKYASSNEDLSLIFQQESLKLLSLDASQQVKLQLQQSLKSELNQLRLTSKHLSAKKQKIFDSSKKEQIKKIHSQNLLAKHVIPLRTKLDSFLCHWQNVIKALDCSDKDAFNSETTLSYAESGLLIYLQRDILSLPPESVQSKISEFIKTNTMRSLLVSLHSFHTRFCTEIPRIDFESVQKEVQQSLNVIIKQLIQNHKRPSNEYFKSLFDKLDLMSQELFIEIAKLQSIQKAVGRMLNNTEENTKFDDKDKLSLLYRASSVDFKKQINYELFDSFVHDFSNADIIIPYEIDSDALKNHKLDVFNEGIKLLGGLYSNYLNHISNIELSIDAMKREKSKTEAMLIPFHHDIRIKMKNLEERCKESHDVDSRIDKFVKEMKRFESYTNEN